MSSNKFNFSPASEHDSVVYGACRPGAEQPEGHEVGDTKVTEGEVKEWVDFMKGKGVTRVVNLLEEESEIKKAYACDLPGIMKQEFNEFHNISLKEPGATDKVVKAFEDAAASGEKVVVHCWQGQGRAGHALASWLVKYHHLPAEEAAQKVLEAAKAEDAARRVNVEKLKEATSSEPAEPTATKE